MRKYRTVHVLPAPLPHIVSEALAQFDNRFVQCLADHPVAAFVFRRLDIVTPRTVTAGDRLGNESMREAVAALPADGCVLSEIIFHEQPSQPQKPPAEDRRLRSIATRIEVPVPQERERL